MSVLGLFSFFKNWQPSGRRKAASTGVDNEFLKQLYSKLGYNINLSPWELKEYVKQGYLINPHVYTVINKIVRPASSVPHYLYKIKDDSKSKKAFQDYQRAIKSNSLEEAHYLKQKSMELISDPRIDKLLANPNPNQSYQEWAEQGMAFQLITGEEFIYGIKAGKDIKEMYNMPPQIVTIEVGNYLNPVKSYKIDFFGLVQDGIDPENVLHIKMVNPDYEDHNFMRGLSPLAPLCRTVKKSNDTQIAQMRILENGHPVGILGNGADRGFDDTAAKDLKRKFRSRFQGVTNINDVLLTSLKLEWIAMGLSTVDMQLLDSDKLDLETIARVYEVPLPLIVNDAATYNNIKEARKECWMTARLPLMKRRRDALNRWLLPNETKGRYIDFDLQSIEDLRQDDKELVERLAMEIQNAMLSPNEAREIRGREPHKNPLANELYMGNFKPLTNEQPKSGQGN